MPRSRTQLLLGVCLLASITCAAPRELTEDAAPPLAAELSGCAFERADGRCTLAPERTLRVFVPARDARLFAAGRVLSFAARKVEGGSLLSLTVPAGVAQLEVEANGSRRAFVLEDGAPSALDRVQAHKNAGEFAQARRLLEASASKLSSSERARAEGLTARMALAEGRLDEAEAAFRRALALDRQHGLSSQEMADASALSFLLSARRADYEGAAQVLEHARARAESTADGRAQFPYFEGLIALERGDLRHALSLFRSSEARTERLGLSLHAYTAKDRLAATLDALGRSDDAMRALEGLYGRADLRGCERADVTINLAWFLDVQPNATHADRMRATELLDEARALFPAACSDPGRQAIAETNLAFAALHLGDLARAERAHHEAERLAGEANEGLGVWWALFEGELALARAETERALSAFTRALGRAGSQDDPAFRARVGRARALEQAGALAKARTAFDEAEGLLDARALLAPLGEGRAAFLWRHAESLRGAVRVSLALGDVRGAFARARHGRSRLLRAVEQSTRLAALSGAERARWHQATHAQRTGRLALRRAAEAERDLPVDELERAEAQRARKQRELERAFETALSGLPGSENHTLPALDPEALTLLFHDSGEGIIGFAAQGGEVAVHGLGRRPEPVSKERDAAWLLEPFGELIARARRVRIMGEGVTAEVDVHALPFQGRPLATHVPVEYALDLPARASAARARRAVVIADPGRDLPHARSEADDVLHALAERGFTLTSLTGQAARAEAVERALGEAALVHFAGHALSAGHDGWESVLELAEGEALAVGDVLSSPVPESVVLSSCEASLSERDGLVSLSMADAFLLAGAARVVAPNRKIDDRDTSRLMHALYRRDEPDLGSALTAVQRELYQAEDPMDWSAFRVITR